MSSGSYEEIPKEGIVGGGNLGNFFTRLYFQAKKGHVVSS
jgi:hypothetical protein